MARFRVLTTRGSSSEYGSHFPDPASEMAIVFPATQALVAVISFFVSVPAKMQSWILEIYTQVMRMSI